MNNDQELEIKKKVFESLKESMPALYLAESGFVSAREDYILVSFTPDNGKTYYSARITPRSLKIKQKKYE